MPDMFVGYSSFSGTSGTAAEIAITKLVMTNRDEHHLGEHLVDEQKYGDSLDKLMQDEHSYKDDKSQRKALDNLNALLEKYVELSSDTGLLDRLNALNTKMSSLEHEAKAFTQEIRHGLRTADGNVDHTDVHHMRQEIGGLAKLLHAGHARHHEDIDEVRRKANYLPG
jgi:hypothetical protein